MNIFASYADPVKCAVVLDDGRVNKMLTESVQMLAVACYTHNVPTIYIPVNVNNQLYSAKSHKHHPCTIWASLNKENFLWLLHHAKALSDEYTKRFGKYQHNSSNVANLYNAVHYIKDGALTKWPNCATMHKYIDDIHLAYKLELEYKWANVKPKYRQTWYKQPTFPGWIKE